MASEPARARRRRWLLACYVGLYALTLIGIRQDAPRLWGLPLWYVWTGIVLVLLVPLNLWFVRSAWPSEEPSYDEADRDRRPVLHPERSAKEADRE